MSLLLGQLIYSSFTGIGFTTLASVEVPVEIQQIFLKQIVYQYWDAYNPPDIGYQAIYIQQISSDQILFGWLYNDGFDEFGRACVPYFVCYHLKVSLNLFILNNILTCLQTGPVAFFPRTNLPDYLESILVTSFSNYQSNRSGVKISQKMCEEISTVLIQNQLIHLFVSNEQNTRDTANFNLVKYGNTPPARSRTLTLPRRKLGRGELHLNLPLVTQSLIPNLLQHNIIGKGSQQAILSFPKLLIFSYVTIFSLLFIILMYVFYNLSLLSPINIFPQNPYVTSQKQKSGIVSDKISNSVLTEHTDSVWSIILSNENQNLVSGSADKTIKIWNLKTGKVQHTLTGHNDVIRSLVFSSDRQNLISADSQGKVRIWNWQTKQLIKILNICSVPLWSIVMSSDNRTLISGDENGNLIFSDIHTGKILQVIKGHSGRIFSIAISPDGKKLVTGGIDKKIKIWELPTGKLLQTLNGHSDAVRSVTFSPNGQQIASGSWDNTIKIWNLQTGGLLRNLQGHTARVTSITFSTDGKKIISGSIDNTIKVWNLESGQLLYSFTSHSNWILGVTVSSDKIFSASKDTTIRIWTLPP
ncbi:WD40 repeat domain-containing protein [Scytonema sp. NUACC26]|uniref:WD40 repeat domain-containing protein n=1 Tax=Scytonema sp. NUACC26 TaxID=3140176 RepID=UPI0034DBBB07